jgi:ABC-type sugar transport system substrate-binding protein
MSRMGRRVVALAAVLAVLLMASPARADDSKLKVKVGDPFPTVAVPATQAGLVKKDAKELSITDFKGKIVVVAFYPKALTGG